MPFYRVKEVEGRYMCGKNEVFPVKKFNSIRLWTQILKDTDDAIIFSKSELEDVVKISQTENIAYCILDVKRVGRRFGYWVEFFEINEP